MSFFLSPRLSAMVALTALLAFGAGAHAGEALPTQDFYFSFNADLTDGSISGGGTLMAQEQTPGLWLVTGATGGLRFTPPDPCISKGISSAACGLTKSFSLSYLDPMSYMNNDNYLLIYGTGSLLTVYGIALQVGDGFGSLNIADGSYNFTTTFAGTGTGSFFATPGPAPGTGLAGFAVLILAGAAVRARGLLAR